MGLVTFSPASPYLTPIHFHTRGKTNEIFITNFGCIYPLFNIPIYLILIEPQRSNPFSLSSKEVFPMKRFALVGILTVSLLLSAFVVVANNSAIDLTRAQEIARAQYPDATIVKVERTFENGRWLWDVKFDNGMAVYVDDQSGVIVEVEAWRSGRAAGVPRGWVAPVTSPTAVDIGTDGVSLQEALSIAQSYYPDAAPFEADLERERGHDVWDIKLDNGIAVYIDARNGAVLEFEVQRGPRWDKRDDRARKGPPPLGWDTRWTPRVGKRPRDQRWCAP
jgi:uncharacterized membrane protein YkoI